MKIGDDAVPKKSATLLPCLLLLASCATAPTVQLHPDPEAQTCIRELPELDPLPEDAQGLISIETMQNFLRGTLLLRFDSSLQPSPATSSTERPKRN